MVKIKNLDVKQYFTVLIAIVILTDIMILLNVPLLRQILGFLCFTIIPGILIIHILKLDKIEFLKKFVLSIGLSITFLMFAGLFVNSFYPIISKPLSLPPVFISFNILLMVLAFIAYKRNKDNFDTKDVFNFKIDLKDKLTSPLIFSLLFPFMAIFGTYLMNTQENNIILLAMLFLIPAYVVVVVYWRDRIHEATYPVAIWMIGMALLLMVGLRSNNLASGVCNAEYYFFQATLNSSHWDNSLITKILSDYNACLSVTILPAIYQIFLEMQEVYIFKLIFNLLGSIVPLTTYVIFRKYMHAHHAFISSIFFMAQYPFISMLGWLGFRQLIALLFFVLAMLIFFDDKINVLIKKILFLIFVVSLIISHYTTAFIFFIILFLYWSIINLKNVTSKFIGIKSKNITAVTVILFFVLIFFWYGQITSAPITNVALFIKNNLANLVHLSMEGLEHEETVIPIGEKHITDIMNFLVHYISFAFISIGVFSLIKNHRNFEKEYLLMTFISFSILVLLTGASIFIVGYGASRLYQQLLVFTAPAFVIGGETISKFISRFNSKLNMNLMIVVIVLIAQFFSATYMIYQIYGVPYSEFLNSNGIRHDMYYVYDADVAGAEWIHENNVGRPYMGKPFVWGDKTGAFIYYRFDIQSTQIFNPEFEITRAYIYMRTVNTIGGTIYTYHEAGESLSNYTTNLFVERDKIYSNDGSEIYKCKMM